MTTMTTRLFVANAVHTHFRNRSARARRIARRQPSYVGRYGLTFFLLGVILPLVVFAAIANGVMNGMGAFGIEVMLLMLLHGFASVPLDQAADLISMLVTAVGVGMLCWLLWRRLWRTSLFWLLSVAGAAILNSIIKNAIQRERPTLWEAVLPHSSFGFPSGHAMQSMAIAVALMVLFRHSKSLRAIAVAALTCVLIVAACRMYLGLHYPTDVLAGWMLSIAWVTALALLFDGRYLPAHLPLPLFRKRAILSRP
jgi:membrane-associated phospholipid phosphatase